MKKIILATFLLFLSACQSGPQTISGAEWEQRRRAAAEAEEAAKDTDCPDAMKNLSDGARCMTTNELIAEACRNKDEISTRQGEIAYEKEIGKKAGFVDAGKIYQATKDIDLDQYSIREIRKHLKKKFHQTLNLKACPKER